MECLPIYNANETADLLHEALVIGDQFPSQSVMSPWICAMLGSTAIGVTGVLPILVIPVDRDFNAGGSPSTFRLLLSFAVGCLLGDVWLHLLPEIWSHSVASHSANGGALWLLGGLLTFFILEKLLSSIPSTDPKTVIANCNQNNNNENEKQSKLHISSGYLNLMANSMDNFTHGLAVGASFLVSVPRGVLTTAAILLHEIPHEVGDFAILLRSGFSRWDAVRAQLLTASAGLIGSLGAIYASGGTFGGGEIESRTAWMLPFTAGGFLHIALVTILPDLLEETSPTQSILQLASMLGGVALMGGLASFTE